jgi:uncharacterized membrane protein YoaK (UPF0700 family)
MSPSSRFTDAVCPRRQSRLSDIVQRLRSPDVLLIILAVTTGATDATAFERLGNAFASVITGNLVLLGVGAASGNGRPALLAGCAIAGYAAGAFGGAPRDPDHAEAETVWPAAATRVLGGDLVLLVIVSVFWETSDGHPGRALQLVLLTLAAAAMGVQSTAIRRLGPISTTYLTGTFISIFEALAQRRFSHAHRRSVAILVAALAGAALATGLILSARALVPVIVLGPLLTVILASRRLAGSP